MVIVTDPNHAAYGQALNPNIYPQQNFNSQSQIYSQSLYQDQYNPNHPNNSYSQQQAYPSYQQPPPYNTQQAFYNNSQQQAPIIVVWLFIPKLISSYFFI